jgi:hypothetical protein
MHGKTGKFALCYHQEQKNHHREARTEEVQPGITEAYYPQRNQITQNHGKETGIR